MPNKTALDIEYGILAISDEIKKLHTLSDEDFRQSLIFIIDAISVLISDLYKERGSSEVSNIINPNNGRK